MGLTDVKLLILSDLHLEFGAVLVPRVDCDVLILAGDISVPGSRAMRWARQVKNGPTVVVTHQAPHRNALAPHYQSDWLSASFATERPSSFFEVPSLWVHGHVHASLNYDVGNCRVVCNPRGYLRHGRDPENKQFNPKLVVEL